MGATKLVIREEFQNSDEAVRKAVFQEKLKRLIRNELKGVHTAAYDASDD